MAKQNSQSARNKNKLKLQMEKNKEYERQQQSWYLDFSRLLGTRYRMANKTVNVAGKKC